MNPDTEEARVVRAYSNREKIYKKIEISVVSDIDECWISENVVDRLQLTRRPNSEDDGKWGCLGLRTFEFSGTVSLQWICNVNSRVDQCRVVPSNEFKIYLPSSKIPPIPPPNQPTDRSTIDLDECPLPEGSSPVKFSGQFDGEELVDYLESSKE